MYGAGKVHIKFWWRDMMERDLLEDLDVEERLILKRNFEKWGWANSLDRSGSG
jgi:hypothetical protein